MLQISFYRGVHHRRCLEDEDEEQPSWTCVNSSFKFILISIILKFVEAHCGLLLFSLVPWLS